MDSVQYRALSRTLIGAKCSDYSLDLLFKFHLHSLPAHEVGRQSFQDLGGLTAFPPTAEQVPIKVERNEDKNLPPLFLHQLLFFCEGLTDFVIDPPTL